MTISWTQNVVILEAELTLRERVWYIRAAKQFGWSKLELQQNIVSGAHLEIALDFQDEVCYTEENNTKVEQKSNDRDTFFCHGNICCSPMAEFVMKNLVKKAGLESQFHIESTATSAEEIDNPVYLPACRKLAERGIDCTGKTACQLRNSDYDQFDLLIGMDKVNLRNMYRICGGNFDDKLHLLMEFTGQPDSEVADPWYTGDFEATWQNVLEGCTRLLEWLTQQQKIEEGAS